MANPTIGELGFLKYINICQDWRLNYFITMAKFHSESHYNFSMCTEKWPVTPTTLPGQIIWCDCLPQLIMLLRFCKTVSHPCLPRTGSSFVPCPCNLTLGRHISSSLPDKPNQPPTKGTILPHTKFLFYHNYNPTTLLMTKDITKDISRICPQSYCGHQH